MQDLSVKPAPLPWWAAGLLLGMVQILAIAVAKPLGVSTQFVVVEGVALNKIAPSYSEGHALLSSHRHWPQSPVLLRDTQLVKPFLRKECTVLGEV